MRNVAASWLAVVMVLVPSWVCAEPASVQTPSIADQRAARAACLKQFHPTFGVDDDRWRRFNNCVSGGNAPAVPQPNTQQAQGPPPAGALPTPSPSPSHADFAQCNLTQSERAKTIAACTRIINAARAKFGSSPDFANAWFAFFVRGTNYAGTNNIPPAIDDLTEAIRLHPNFAFAYVGRGTGYLDTGQFALAISDLSRAIELAQQMASTENNGEAWGPSLLYRATAYAKMGESRKAVQDYEDLKRQFPTLASDPLDPALAKATSKPVRRRSSPLAGPPPVMSFCQ